MAKLAKAVKEIHRTDHTGGIHTGKGGIHPLSRLLVVFCYILAVVSFPKYDLRVSEMILYLLIQCIWHEISLKNMLKHIWPALLFTGMVGIANPFLDRSVCLTAGNLDVTYGMLSMVTLMEKGVFCVMASYILVTKTGIAQICHALRCLHIPEELITVLSLMHRYLMVLLKEVERMQQAYRLRAPGQNGLHIKTWGSFVGLLLLRSMDRAEEVYESMKLRGFGGQLPDHAAANSHIGQSILYVAVWYAAILLFRFFPVFQFAGKLFTLLK